MKNIKIGQVWKLKNNSLFSVLILNTKHINDGFIKVCAVVNTYNLGDEFDVQLNNKDFIKKTNLSYRVLRLSQCVILADNLERYKNTLTPNSIEIVNNNINNINFNYHPVIRDIINFYCNKLNLYRNNALNKMESLL